MKKFHPGVIRRLVFDLDSLTVDFDQEAWKNFRKFIHILDDRDFETVLIAKSIELSRWETFSRLTILQGTCDDAYKKNDSLSGSDVFWFSEQPSLQKLLSKSTRNFAGSNSQTLQNGGLQYQNLYDILQIFHPSKITAKDLSSSIFKLKLDSEQVPLVVGVGGPDDCGHSFFVGELIEALEEQEVLVSSLDLSQILGTEFKKNDSNIKKNMNSRLWCSEDIREWLIEDVLSPYYNGEQVYIETPPSIIKDFDITVFPFFLAPEMILIIWGTTIFIPEFERFLDLRILLELSEKSAAARMFGLDDRENFDQAFVDTYSKKEGKHYSDYLEVNGVLKKIDYRIDFENFNSFRIKRRN